MYVHFDISLCKFRCRQNIFGLEKYPPKKELENSRLYLTPGCVSWEKCLKLCGLLRILKSQSKKILEHFASPTITDLQISIHVYNYKPLQISLILYADKRSSRFRSDPNHATQACTLINIAKPPTTLIYQPTTFTNNGHTHNKHIQNMHPFTKCSKYKSRNPRTALVDYWLKLTLTRIQSAGC